MIVNMYRYSFMVFHNDYASFLDKLKELGVLHIKELETEPTSAMQETMRHASEAKRIADILNSIEPIADSSFAQVKNGAEVIDLVQNLRLSIERNQQQESFLQKELQRYEPWGGKNLTYNALSRLTDANIQVKLYACMASKFNSEWQENGVVEIVSQMNGYSYFIAVGIDSLPIPAIDAEEITLPEMSYNAIEEQLKQVEVEISQALKHLASVANYGMPILEEYQKQLADDLQTMIVHQSTRDTVEGSVKLLEGYVPEDSVAELDKWLATVSVYTIKEKAKPEDCPPIKLNNSAFAKLFEPITNMYSLPNYSEIDPTPLFAPFFMLFFGLCFGDAGYGLLVLLIVLIAKRKVPENLKNYCNLGIVLSAATVVVSLMTGIVFGVDLSDPEVGLNENIRKLFISEKNFRIAGYSPMMIISVILGLIQILFAMCVKAAKLTKQSGGKYAIATISWVVILPLLAFTFGAPMLGVELPSVVLYLCYAFIGLAAVGIFFFNNPDSSIIANVGSGIWTTYNMATGLLGDALSYIRLFALGLTGGILGSVFNTMAFMAGDGLPWYAKFIVVLLILLVGHAINICLCLIGAFVHPMRLTFVEFYKNAGFEGGGKEYKPFGKQ